MWPFKNRSITVKETTAAEVLEALRAMRARVDSLEDELQKLTAQHMSLRGRVYAIWGKKNEAVEPTPPAENDLRDPRLTKEELRARLLPHGKRFKHTN